VIVRGRCGGEGAEAGVFGFTVAQAAAADDQVDDLDDLRGGPNHGA